MSEDSGIFIVVAGTPQTAGSKKAFLHPVTRQLIVKDDNEHSGDWKKNVAAACMTQYGGPLLTGPLAVEVTFFKPRNKGHFGSGKNASVLKDSAPMYPTVKPDVDKLSRAILDGLTGVLWRDDAQVVTKVACKRYGEPARAEIRVTPITVQTVGDAAAAQQMTLVA